ncbi:uncharacterized protein LOC110974511 [Acanthaster planci]|uniref:Uncharacterized protein LOC110974511 n=1 Tax=Acanthaster planci TaxID=133434 RepID=A0A8B7XP07_ACAPL|nr:uncharacterized protein LOC110974511 [Acanthaster planci]
MEAMFIWALVVTLVCGGAHVGANPFRVEPQNTNAALGETVVLPCILRNTTLSHCNVFWYRSDQQVYISRNRRIIDRLSPDVRERYSILGNRSSGVYSLQIQDVAEADAGEYQCTCFPRSHANSYLSPPAAIYIVIRPPPEYPICRLREGTGPLMVGQRVSFVCEANGGRPSVALQWMQGRENLVADFTFNPHSISVYHKTLALEDSEEILTCVASGLALKSPRNCTVGPLSIVSPLQIQTQKIVAKHGGREDPRVVFTCNSNMNLTGLVAMYNYTWYANGARITTSTPGFILGNDGTSVQVTDLSLFSQNIHIVCAAHGMQGSLGNVSTFLDMDSIVGFPTISHAGHPKTDPPNKGIVSVAGNQHLDVRPFVYLILGAFILMTTMIAIVVCTPRTCCHPKSGSRLRRRDSKFTTMHYVQQPTGSPARAIAHQESLNLYESTADSDTESMQQGATLTAPSLTQQQQQQKQQVQATLHVVVHSGNNSSNQHQTLTRGNSGTLADDQSSVYQEMPPTPPPLPPHSSHTLRLHPPKTPSGALRTQTWGHSSCKANAFNFEQVPADLMHYDHLRGHRGCYVQTLPMRPSRPALHQKFLHTPQYAELNKFNHKGTAEGLYENVPVPIHHGRSLSLNGY